MRSSAFFVALGLCAASRLDREDDDGTLAQRLGSLTLSNEDNVRISDAVAALFDNSAPGVREYIREYNLTTAIITPLANDLEKLDRDISAVLMKIDDIVSTMFEMTTPVSRIGLGSVVVANTHAAAHPERYNAKIKSLHKSIVKLHADLSRRIDQANRQIDAAVAQERQLYTQRLTRSINALQKQLDEHADLAVYLYLLFESSLASTELAEADELVEDSKTYAKFVQNYDLSVYKTFLSVIDKNNETERAGLNQRLRAQTIVLNVMLRKYPNTLQMRSNYRFHRLAARAEIARGIITGFVVKGLMYDKFHMLHLSDIIGVKINCVSSTKNICINADTTGKSVRPLTAKAGASAKAPIVPETWAEGEQDRVRAALLAQSESVSQEPGQKAVTFDQGPFVEMQRTCVKMHSDMHARLLMAKESREYIVVEDAASDFVFQWGQLAVCPTIDAAFDSLITSDVLFASVEIVNSAASLSAALKQLESKLLQERCAHSNLNKQMGKLKHSHKSAQERVASASASVSVLETQLASFISQQSAAMDAKTQKKWDRAILSHAAAVTELEGALSGSIAALRDIYAAGEEVCAASTRIRALELAVASLK